MKAQLRISPNGQRQPNAMKDHPTLPDYALVEVCMVNVLFRLEQTICRTLNKEEPTETRTKKLTFSLARQWLYVLIRDHYRHRLSSHISIFIRWNGLGPGLEAALEPG